MQIVIRQILSDLLDDIAASQQRLHFLMDILSGIVNEGANDRIVAGISPIAGRFGFWIFPQVPQIVHHVPGAVDIQLPEVIAVIPSFHIFGVVRLLCVTQDLVYFFLREAKVFIQMSGSITRSVNTPCSASKVQSPLFCVAMDRMPRQP